MTSRQLFPLLLHHWSRDRGSSTHPADDTLPVGSSISGFVLLRQTLEVINPEAVVTREDVPGEVTLEAVPVVALRLPLLQGTKSRAQVWVTPPSDRSRGGNDFVLPPA